MIVRDDSAWGKTLDAIEAFQAEDDRAAIGATRACPDCGRPQHYTGTEYGWAHDAVIDLMRCAASPELLAEMEKCWRRDGRA